MFTRKHVVSRIVVLLLILAGICQAREVETSEQPPDPNAAPVVKYMEYGFDILDIMRGIKEKIDIEVSATVKSKHIWNGIDILDDHGVFVPVVTVVFGDSGFTGKVIDGYPLSSGFERSVERNYGLFYTGVLREDETWVPHYTLNYWYYGKQKVSGGENDSQEFGSTLFWPGLIPVGENSITPSYYLGYIWAAKSNSNVRGCEGFIHVFALNYDFEIADFWPDGTKQAFRLHGDLTYNDGFGAGVIEHDWSHLTLGINTNITKGNWTITPSLNYQVSMEDSVNSENELWCGITTTYKF
jgi:hypothetical protein